MQWSSFLFLKPPWAVAKCGFKNKKSGNETPDPKGHAQKKIMAILN
jgi:hypothetical protein